MGNIHPQESALFSTPQLKELLGYIDRHYKELESSLTDEQRVLFEKMMDCRNEYDSLIETAVFNHGFRLGSRVILDVLTETDF